MNSAHAVGVLGESSVGGDSSNGPDLLNPSSPDAENLESVAMDGTVMHYMHTFFT